MSHKGGCLCGQVRYEMQGEPMFTMVCHCKNCQKQAGAAFSINLITTEDKVVTTGDLKTFEDVADSKNILHRQFCQSCGSPVFSKPVSQKGMVVIKAGTLDDTSSLKPQMHIWTKSAQAWVKIPDDLPQFPDNPVI